MVHPMIVLPVMASREARGSRFAGTAGQEKGVHKEKGVRNGQPAESQLKMARNAPQMVAS